MQRRHLQQLAVWLLGLSPALWLGVALARDELGANPIETLTHRTGAWTLRFLLLSLSITPLRRHAGLRTLAPFRRTLGLLSFVYAALHFSIYCLDQYPLSYVVEDVVERPYITVGFAALLCLLLLALTSTRGWMRRLGARWTTLHRLVYVAGILAIVHFSWLVKADLLEPLVYGAILAALLLARALPGRAVTR